MSPPHLTGTLRRLNQDTLGIVLLPFHTEKQGSRHEFGRHTIPFIMLFAFTVKVIVSHPRVPCTHLQFQLSNSMIGVERGDLVVIRPLSMLTLRVSQQQGVRSFYLIFLTLDFKSENFNAVNWLLTLPETLYSIFSQTSTVK